jgi:hypothetical protein
MVVRISGFPSNEGALTEIFSIESDVFLLYPAIIGLSIIDYRYAKEERSTKGKSYTCPDT